MIVPSGSSQRSVGPVHHVSIAVSDLERSERFYGEMLGLRATMRSEVGGPQNAAVVGTPLTARARIQVFDGGVRIGQIELVEWSTRDDAIESTPRSVTRPGSMILAFEVGADELSPLHARLTAEGYHCWSVPGRIDLPGFGYAIAFIVDDPDANPIELMALVRER